MSLAHLKQPASTRGARFAGVASSRRHDDVRLIFQLIVGAGGASNSDGIQRRRQFKRRGGRECLLAPESRDATEMFKHREFRRWWEMWTMKHAEVGMMGFPCSPGSAAPARGPDCGLGLWPMLVLVRSKMDSHSPHLAAFLATEQHVWAHGASLSAMHCPMLSPSRKKHFRQFSPAIGINFRPGRQRPDLPALRGDGI